MSYRAALGVLDSEADPDIKLKAIDWLNRIAERRAKLYGLDAPVKVDATVTQQTQQEAKLEFFIAEAVARNEQLMKLDPTNETGSTNC